MSVEERRLQTWSESRSNTRPALGCASLLVMCFGFALIGLVLVALILFMPAG
jgi:hypothetical protein